MLNTVVWVYLIATIVVAGVGKPAHAFGMLMLGGAAQIVHLMKD